MKKMIMLAACVSFALTSLAQKPNPAIVKLFNEFGHADIERTYSADNKGQEYYLALYKLPKADMDDLIQYNRLGQADFPFQLEGTKEYIDSQLKQSAKVQHDDSVIKPVIKHTLDSLAPLSKECYHYEVHNGLSDTTKYVLALNNMPEDLFQQRVKGRVEKKAGNEFIDYFSYNRGTFLHYILPPLQRSTLATLYTEESLKTHIEAILTKYKGKKYTVSYDINSGANIYPQDWYILKHSDESHSKSYGTHYYIPTTKNVQNDLVKEIAEAVTQFLTSTSDTSEYSLFYTLPLGNAKYNSSAYDHLIFCIAESSARHFSINMKMTDNGLHVLLLSNEGEWLVPRRSWWKIKAIRGENIVYEKNFLND